MPPGAPGRSEIDALALSTAQNASAETAIGPIDPGSLGPTGRAPGDPLGAAQPVTQVLSLVPQTWTVPREGGPIPLAPDLTQGGSLALTEAAGAPRDAAPPVGTALEPPSPDSVARPAANASGSPAGLGAWPDEGQAPVIDAAPAADRESPTTDRPTTRPAADQTVPAFRAVESRPVDLVAVQPASLADLARTSSGGEIAPSAQAIDGTNPSFPTGGLAQTARAERAAFFPLHDQVALHVSRALEDGWTEIRIHLRPADLGNVDIRLEFHDLRLTATVSADRAETLDLLQRDARGLTRAFREAGVDIDPSGLSFTHSGRGGHSGDRGGDLQDPAVLTVAPDEPDGPPVQAQAAHRGLLALWDGRVDVLV
jgi:flagellar hook-length control protein FliK